MNIEESKRRIKEADDFFKLNENEIVKIMDWLGYIYDEDENLFYIKDRFNKFIPSRIGQERAINIFKASRVNPEEHIKTDSDYLVHKWIKEGGELPFF